MRRAATLDDVDEIVAMGERFRSQTEYETRIAPNPDVMRALAMRLIGDPDGLILVADLGTQLVGMLATIIYAHHISGERVAGEVAWWVDPEQRGDIGLGLLHDVERWARARGAIWLEMLAPNARIEQLYTRLGYAPVERTYHKRL